jgi:hypothetical protein
LSTIEKVLSTFKFWGFFHDSPRRRKTSRSVVGRDCGDGEAVLEEAGKDGRGEAVEGEAGAGGEVMKDWDSSFWTPWRKALKSEELA